MVVATGAIQLAMFSIRRNGREPRKVQISTWLPNSTTRLWQFEELHRAFGIAQHPGEQFLAPDRHSRPRGGKQGLAGEEEAGVHHLADRPAAFELAERLGDVDLFHEAVTQDHAEETGAIVRGLDPLFGRHVGDILDPYGEQDDAFVKHLVVLRLAAGMGSLIELVMNTLCRHAGRDEAAD